mgnify:CR=1 FL=1
MWISTSDAHRIYQLHIGEAYVLHEKEAPEGYLPAEEKGENRHVLRCKIGDDVDMDGNGTGLVCVVERDYHGELTVEAIRQFKLEVLDMYDKSNAVNELEYDGRKMWFDKMTRTCIAYSMQTEMASGKTATELYDEKGNCYTLPISDALRLFGELELYAKACYNVTARHRAELNVLESVSELLDYDITEGYPNKLVFVGNQHESGT